MNNPNGYNKLAHEFQHVISFDNGINHTKDGDDIKTVVSRNEMESIARAVESSFRKQMSCPKSQAKPQYHRVISPQKCANGGTLVDNGKGGKMCLPPAPKR